MRPEISKAAAPNIPARGKVDFEVKNPARGNKRPAIVAPGESQTPAGGNPPTSPHKKEETKLYKLNFTPDFQAETGYLQECNLLFENFLDAIKYAHDIAIKLYPPNIAKIIFRGTLDDYGNFRCLIKYRTLADVPNIAEITLS